MNEYRMAQFAGIKHKKGRTQKHTQVKSDTFIKYKQRTRSILRLYHAFLHSSSLGEKKIKKNSVPIKPFFRGILDDGFAHPSSAFPSEYHDDSPERFISSDSKPYPQKTEAEFESKDIRTEYHDTPHGKKSKEYREPDISRPLEGRNGNQIE